MNTHNDRIENELKLKHVQSDGRNSFGFDASHTCPVATSDQRPPSSKLPPRASYRRAQRLRKSPMLLSIKDAGNRMAVLLNLARYCTRVSNRSLGHRASVLRILLLISCHNV